MKRLVSCLLLLAAVWMSDSGRACAQSDNIVLVGSTPADAVMKSLLGIRRETKVDFVRWNIVLNAPDGQQKEFVMDITFGESQPNTLGFKGGGERRSITGAYIQERSSKIHRDVYRLESRTLPEVIGIVKLTENVYHFLTPENQLMVGNGGWSYTLNRKNPVADKAALPLLFAAMSKAANESEVVYDGRTPCREIADEHPEMRVSQGCFKLKWRLILRKDAAGRPTTYTIRKVVDGSVRNITGEWVITRGTESNPNVTIYTLEPDKAESISFLVGDENVLFFLKKDKTLLIGNKDFSFTLNKRLDK